MNHTESPTTRNEKPETVLLQSNDEQDPRQRGLALELAVAIEILDAEVAERIAARLQLEVEPLAHLLSALGVGSAMYVAAHADDPEEARQEITRCYQRFLAGIGVGDVGCAVATDQSGRAGRGTPTQ